VERVNLIDQIINGCIGCDSCQEVRGIPACSQIDAAVWIIDHILTADLVVYAMPVYVWSFPANMKALLERHYALMKWKLEGAPSLLAGKPVMLLATCGANVVSGADLLLEAFKREMDYLDARILGRYVVDGTTSSASALGDKRKDTADLMWADLNANPLWIERCHAASS
jgi:multimeric flavodoxin WrbA